MNSVEDQSVHNDDNYSINDTDTTYSQSWLNLDFGIDNVLRGIIYSEILGPPLSKR